MLFYVLSAGFTLWMAVEAVRRGQAGTWLWIILMFGPIGAGVYFFAEYWGQGPGIAVGARRVRGEEVRQAALDARRLDTAGSWAQLASLLRARGDFVGAVDASQKAVERAPQDVDARYELGRALLGAGRPQEALEPLAAVALHDPGYDKGEVLMALSQAQEATGDRAGARTSLEHLAERSALPEVLYHLALLQSGLGDTPAAQASLQRIVDESQYAPDYMRRRLRPWVKRAQKGLILLSEGKPLL